MSGCSFSGSSSFAECRKRNAFPRIRNSMAQESACNTDELLARLGASRRCRTLLSRFLFQIQKNQRQSAAPCFSQGAEPPIIPHPFTSFALAPAILFSYVVLRSIMGHLPRSAPPPSYPPPPPPHLTTSFQGSEPWPSASNAKPPTTTAQPASRPQRDATRRCRCMIQNIPARACLLAWLMTGAGRPAVCRVLDGRCAGELRLWLETIECDV